MALSCGFRPRTRAERLQMAVVMHTAPQEVAITFADDGWACACLRIAGRTPVWAHHSDPEQVEQRLRSLGLPGLGHGAPWATLSADLELVSHEEPAWSVLPPVVGPLVTVLVCTYNRVDLLPGAIQSALDQRWPTEVLVVNDGSTDGTRALLDRTAGIRVLHQENTGKPGALARGLAAARGEAVLVLDDDDRLLPGALHVLGRALFKSPERVAVFGDTVQFTDHDETPRGYVPATRMPGAMAERVVVQEIPAMPGACLVRMRTQRTVGDYDPRLVRGQDMDMYLRLAQHGPMESVPLPTFRYRVHAGQRGRAGERYDPADTVRKQQVFLHYTQPVFAERWKERAPRADRLTTFDYAMGLHLRSLGEAAREAAEQAPPFTPYERWVREQVGLTGGPEAPTETTLLVVDDGDDGALEETLYLHANGHRLVVNLEVPREPMGSILRYWPGHYVAQRPLEQVLTAEHLPVQLRLSSAPDWVPPALVFLDDLPRGLPPRDQLLALAATEGWPVPGRVRIGLRRPLHPDVARLWQCRRALSRGRPQQALELLPDLLARHPDWRGAWRLGVLIFEALGMRDQAQRCLEVIA